MSYPDPAVVSLNAPGSYGNEHEEVKREFSTTTAHGPSEQFALEQAEAPGEVLSRGHTIFVIANLTGIAFASSMSTGLLTVGLPRIATDLTLSQNLLLWSVMNLGGFFLRVIVLLQRSNHSRVNEHSPHTSMERKAAS